MVSVTGLTTRFDQYFVQWHAAIPVEYLRVLSWYESSHKEHNREGAAWGLLEVTPVVMADFNKRYSTSYTMNDVAEDVSLNVRMACETLRRVIKVYGLTEISALKESWGNWNWLVLLTMGWNSGYSTQGGLAKVAKYLMVKGIPIVPENIRKYAVEAGGSKWLAERETTWARKVATHYFIEVSGKVKLEC